MIKRFFIVIASNGERLYKLISQFYLHVFYQHFCLHALSHTLACVALHGLTSPLLSHLSPDFNKKLQAMGFELSDEGSASYNFKNGNDQAVANDKQASTATKKSSIYRLVSKKCKEPERPVVKQQSTSSLKKVQFQEHNTSTESDSSTDRREEQFTETEGDTMDETDDFDPPSEEIQSETQESFDDSFNSGSESSIPESYRSPSKRKPSQPQQQQPYTVRSHEHLTEDEDISMSAFVPASVRRESVLPQRHDDTSSITSEDSMDYVNNDQGNRGRERYSSQDSSEAEQTYKKQRTVSTDDSEDEECDRAEMDDLLDEAMDDISEVEMRKKDPQPTPVNIHYIIGFLACLFCRKSLAIVMIARSSSLSSSCKNFNVANYSKKIKVLTPNLEYLLIMQLQEKGHNSFD